MNRRPTNPPLTPPRRGNRHPAPLHSWEGLGVGSWSQCTVIKPWGLSMNCPLSAWSKDVGNKTGIDMGNTFHFICGFFHRHDVEKTFCCGAAAAVGEVGFEEPRKPLASVPAFWNESQEWLQVAGALPTRGTAWPARPGVSAAPLAAANILGMGGPDSTFAAPIQKLGQQETGGSTWQGISRASRSLCADDWQLVEAAEAESSSASPFSGRAAAEAGQPDGGATKQPRMDRGLQRMVSNRRWSACGTIDRTGRVQSLPPEGFFAPGSELEPGAEDFPAIVPRERLSRCDPRGQWQSLWIQRPGWADAIERVVDGLGNWSRIHHARTSGTERGARTDASCAQERNDATALAAPAGAATAHPSLGEGIQPNPSASGAWPTIARATVSAQSGADPQGGGELSKGVGSASCPDQRRSQVARQKAIPGRSLRRISGRDQNQRSGPMGGLFWKHPAWRVVGVGCGRGSSGALRPCELMPLHQLGSRTRGRGTNPRAASCPLLRSGSLRSPPLRSGQDAAFPSHL